MGCLSFIVPLAATLATAAQPAVPEKRLVAGYMFNLSDLHGDVASSGAFLAYDPALDEIYVSDAPGRGFRVYNRAGIQVDFIGASDELGSMYRLAVMEGGDLVILSNLPTGEWAVFHCDYRGTLIERVAIKEIPADFDNFRPGEIDYQNGKIYLADGVHLRVLVIDLQGAKVAAYDLAKLVTGEIDPSDLGPNGFEREENSLHGFSVDRKGNLLFTIPTMFKAFVFSPSGQLRAFGIKGGQPGRFNIVAGIAADEEGRFYVADSLRSAIMVFDKDFKFQLEFGGRGFGPGKLIAPTDIRVGNGKVFVSQMRNRGVSVFGLSTR